MQKFDYTYNLYTDRGYLWTEEGPWWAFLGTDAIMNFCDLIPRIPLPRIKIVVKEDDEKVYTDLKDYYGSTHELFHLFICAPLTAVLDKKIKTHLIPIDKELAREMFIKIHGQEKWENKVKKHQEDKEQD